MEELKPYHPTTSFVFTHFPAQFNISEKIIDQSGGTESTQSTQFSFVRTELTIQHLYAKCSKGSAGDVSSTLRRLRLCARAFNHGLPRRLSLETRRTSFS